MSLFGSGTLIARPAQEFMASLVKRAIEGNAVCLVQAATGIGKTLAYIAPAIESGRRTVVSVPTRQLQRQVLREVERLGGSAILRVGMANFFSRTRINRLLVAVQTETHSNGELVAQLKLAREWTGYIEEFIEEHGDLLIDRSLVCLRPGCPAEDRAAYDQQKQEAANSSFVIQTHALTLLEIRYGRHDADVTIFDEAHTLPSIAASSVEARVLLSEVGLDSLTERLGSQEFVLLNDDDREQIKRARELVEDEDMKALLGRIVAPIKTLKQGVGIVSKPLPSLQRVSIDPARFVGWSLKGRPAVFVSATLDPIQQFRTALGLEDVGKEDIGVPRFGSMKITLGDRTVPVPFTAGQPSDDFYAYAAAMIKAAEGRTLVLVPSYDDVERLAALVPNLKPHDRGQPIYSATIWMRTARQSG